MALLPDASDPVETDQLLMGRSGAERMLIGSRMFAAARAMVLASFPPDLPEDEVRRRLFNHFYGDLPREQIPEALRMLPPSR